MPIARTIFAAALLLASGTALASTPSPEAVAKAQAKLDRYLAGRVAGKPVRCVLQSQVRESIAFDGIGILYKVGAVWYLNRPTAGAEDIGYDPILVTDLHGSQLCDIDTVKLIDRGSRVYRGFLTLGEFVPYYVPTGKEREGR